MFEVHQRGGSVSRSLLAKHGESLEVVIRTSLISSPLSVSFLSHARHFCGHPRAHRASQPIGSSILSPVLSVLGSCLLFVFFSWRKWRGRRGWTPTSRAGSWPRRPCRRGTGGSAKERWRAGRTAPSARCPTREPRSSASGLGMRCVQRPTRYWCSDLLFAYIFRFFFICHRCVQRVDVRSRRPTFDMRNVVPEGLLPLFLLYIVHHSVCMQPWVCSGSYDVHARSSLPLPLPLPRIID